GPARRARALRADVPRRGRRDHLRVDRHGSRPLPGGRRTPRGAAQGAEDQEGAAEGRGAGVAGDRAGDPIDERAMKSSRPPPTNSRVTIRPPRLRVVPPPKQRKSSRPPRPPVTFSMLVGEVERASPKVKRRLLELVITARPVLDAESADGQKRLCDLIEAAAQLPADRQWLLLELALLLGDRAR